MLILNDDDIDEIIAGFNEDQLATIHQARALLNLSLKEYVIKHSSHYGFTYINELQHKPVPITH